MATKTTTIKQQEKAEARKAQADALHATIAEQVVSLRTSEVWVSYLDFISKFHSYSFRNTMLIRFQMPHASQVAGFRRWQELGRQVRKGEKSLKIFGYRERKITVEEDQEENQNPSTLPGTIRALPMRYFPVLSVFDISQTDLVEGSEDQRLAKHLRGEDTAGLYEGLAAWMTSQGWNIECHGAGGANGYMDAETKSIVIAPHLEAAQATKTLIHETAHALMHSKITDYQTHRGVYETEAESVAYVVAGAFGMDTSAYSIGYVAGWSNFDAETIEETGNRVLKCAHQLIDALTNAEEQAPAHGA